MVFVTWDMADLTDNSCPQFHGLSAVPLEQFFFFIRGKSAQLWAYSQPAAEVLVGSTSASRYFPRQYYER
jgi:hypothetical protein